MAFPPVEGDSTLNTTAGVTGKNTAAGEGVHGETSGNTSAAVGAVNLANGPAVFGISQGGEGVHGETQSGTFAGVAGINNALTGTGNPGVFGKSKSGEGVHGETSSGVFAAVAGLNSGPTGHGNPSGVFGKSANGEGVHGETSSGTFAGVAGISTGLAGTVTPTNPTGVFGKSQNGEGVHGETSSDTFAAVAGFNNGPASPNRNPSGVFGHSQNGEGVHGETTSAVFAGVAGLNLSTDPSATGNGVFGITSGRGAAGFFTTNGLGSLPAGPGDAVFALSGPSGNAIHAKGGNKAGLFEGSVVIQGASLEVTKVGFIGGEIQADRIIANNKNFRIDHPLDPANKYLVHASIESSERLNLYSGIAVLDSDGQAEVLLPDWFEALNGDFRYQLTCIGGFAAVYVAAKISGNRFRIAGGYAGLEVSWQVAGCRRDRWAQEHPFVTVLDKPVLERLSLNAEDLPYQPVIPS